jgi:PAS domain S-box-containing protein
MIYVSQNIKLFGYDPAILTASPNLYQSLVHPDDRAAVQDSIGHALDNASQRGVIEFRLLTSHGDYRWVENRYTPIRDDSGRLVEIEGLLFDIAERKAAEEKISLLARTDPLTGLANRATFIERFKTQGGAAWATRFAVLYLDLDRFATSMTHWDIRGRPSFITGERLTSSNRDRRGGAARRRRVRSAAGRPEQYDRCRDFGGQNPCHAGRAD